MRKESWEVVLEAKKAGQVKSIGVSNYSIKHLKEIVDHRPQEEWPVVNQVCIPSLIQTRATDVTSPSDRSASVYETRGAGGILSKV